jgi:hypothetical protein
MKKKGEGGGLYFALMERHGCPRALRPLCLWYTRYFMV